MPAHVDYLIMEVRSSRTAGIAHLRYLLPALHFLTLMHKRRFQVRISGLIAETMGRSL